jgi:UDP-GlcNAc:undecaprenyl-phosphate GlcNAc-1-phosphate transferase
LRGWSWRLMTRTSAAWLLLGQTFVLTLPAVYLIKVLGLKMGWVDRPNDRKVHRTPVVTVGGLGIFIGLFASFCLFQLWKGPVDELVKYKENFHLWLLFGASLVLVAVGVWDDLRDCNPFVKLAFQILAAALFVSLRVTAGRTWWFEAEDKAIFYFLLNVAWIVLLLNAINLIDGLDGLAAGTVAIAGFWLLLANMVMANQFLTWVSALLVGGCLAFLVFNFNPASIFMGDTGALLLGLWLGAGSAEGYFVKLSSLILATPIVLLIVPLLEVVSSTLRRLIGGSGVFHADSKHMHHRLLKLGFQHRNIVLFYYGITFLLGMLGFLLAPNGFTEGGAPIPRITDSNMMFGMLVVIVGSVFMGYMALTAIEKRFEGVIEEITQRYEGGLDIEKNLRDLIDEKEKA